MSMRLVASSMVLCLLVPACGDDGAGSAGEASTTGDDTTGMTPTTTGEVPTTGGGSGGVCEPGAAMVCTCPEEQVGEMLCADDGEGFGECVCPEPEAVCGDGMVEGAEVCDDGVNDGGYGGCAGDCGAFGPGCGDAVVNGSEACDDGNAVDGDGCNGDCVASGTPLWTEGYGGEDAGNARARGVAVDPWGNVVVVGEEFVVGQNANVWLRKYTPDGDEIWSRAWDGPSSGDDVAHAVAIDAAGEIVVTGEEYQAGEGANIFIARLGPDGGPIWQISVNGDAGFGDRGRGVAIDPEGRIAVTGESYKGIGLDNVWTRLMEADGTEIWTDVFDANAGNDRGHAVAFTPKGEVLVAGSIYVPIGLADLWLRKYGPDGTVAWTRTADNMSGNDAWHAVAVDADGNIGLVGEVYEVAGLSAIVVAKYNVSGFEVWTQFQDSDGGDNDIGHGVAFGPDKALVAVGEEYTANDFARAWVRKYDPAGAELWTQVFDGQDAGNDIARAVAVDPMTGHVYAAGEEYAINQFAEVWLTKYAP